MTREFIFSYEIRLSSTIGGSESFRVILEVEDLGALLATFHVRPLLVDQILVGQSQDPHMIKLKEEIEKGNKAEFQIRDDGMIVKG